MYSHCLFCNAALGANEAVEAFPVGKRLAFDTAKGRLWVVCGKCQRWNLTPFESRWEAIEQCERLYRGQRLRAQTDNIGMTKTRDGTELVRVGPAPQREFAAWRYGREFIRRQRRRAVVIGAGGAAVLGGTVLSMAPGILTALTAAAPFLWIGGYLAAGVYAGAAGNWSATRVVGEDGKMLRVTRHDLERTYLLGGEGEDPFRLNLKHSFGRQLLTGETGRRALGALLARSNRWGAEKRQVESATSFLSEAGSPQRAATLVAKLSAERAGDFEATWKHFQRNPYQMDSQGRFPGMSGAVGALANRGALPRLPAEQRLALEMALHEETERAAMEGELAVLEAHWREAEEIAAIADGELTILPRTP